MSSVNATAAISMSDIIKLYIFFELFFLPRVGTNWSEFYRWIENVESSFVVGWRWIRCLSWSVQVRVERATDDAWHVELRCRSIELVCGNTAIWCSACLLWNQSELLLLHDRRYSSIWLNYLMIAHKKSRSCKDCIMEIRKSNSGRNWKSIESALMNIVMISAWDRLNTDDR